jgi:hypothetical protein
MIEIDDIIELQTNSDTEKLSFATRYLVYENFTFDLTVQSDKFCGTSHFCVRRDEIDKFCNDLSAMYSSLKGSTRLTDNDSDGFIEISVSEQGHVNVKGQVGGTHEDHFVRIAFMTDQTSIPKFIQDFRDLLKNEYS